MVDFLKNTLVVVNTDPELANNPMIKSVLENIQLKMTSFPDELSLIEELMVQLTGVNAYIKNDKITQTISKIDERIKEILSSSTEGRIRRMYDEVGLASLVSKIKASPAYKEPIVMKYVNNLVYELQYSPRIPKFKYLPGFVGTLSPYTSDSIIKESVDTVQAYIDKNRAKLILLEAISYLSNTAGTFYNATTDKLKKLVLENKMSSDIVMLEMSDFVNIPIVSEMINAIRSFENIKNPQFNLGNGDNGTKVFNYVGPVLKEGKGLVTYFNNRFVHITPETMVKENYQKVVGKTGEITIAEYKEEYVKEHMANFYNLAKAFDSMAFKLKDRGISSQMNRVKIDFKVNESNTLDVYVNNSKIEDIKNLNANELFLMEHPRTKRIALNIFENMDHIFNVEFIKYLINESTNKSALIINLKDDYHIYEIVGTGTINTLKLDGYKLYKYIKENFKYDISKLFQIQINDTMGRAKAIQEKKSHIDKEMKLLDTSLAKITEAKAADDKKQFTSKLEILEEQINKKKHDFKNQYVALDIEMRKILEEDEFPAEFEGGEGAQEGQDAQEEKTINVGDEVVVGDDEEEGIVINKTPKNELVINKKVADIIKEKPEDVKLKDAQAQDAQAQGAQGEKKEKEGKEEEVQEGLAPQIKAEALQARREKAIKAVADKFKGNIPDEEVSKLAAELKISPEDVKKICQKVCAVKESKVNEDHAETREEKIQYILSKSAELDPNSTLTADALSKLENNIIDMIYAGFEQQDTTGDVMSAEIVGEPGPVQAELGAQTGGVQGAVQNGVEMPPLDLAAQGGAQEEEEGAQEEDNAQEEEAQEDKEKEKVQEKVDYRIQEKRYSLITEAVGKTLHR